MEKLAKFRQKEVVNINDGKRLGFVWDVEIDEITGRITSIIIPGGCNLLSIFLGRKEIIIPWNRIKKIGRDIILVDLNKDNLPSVYN